MAEGTFDRDDPRLVSAAWSRLAEPGDTAAGALVAALGPSAALTWATRAAAAPDVARAAVVDLVAEQVAEQDAEQDADARSRLDPQRLLRAVARWAPRVPGLDPARDLRALGLLGGRLVVPGEPQWPTGLDDLGIAAPHCLWVRGEGDLASLSRRSVALVGARACTEYGRHVATDIGFGVAGLGFTVVSGGAYGIDAAAHRGALAAPSPTVAFLAGGVDRLYPAGNADLLRAVLADGAVVAESPPGTVPARVRFLQRNRLIAATSRATVVVEAAWRSGALSTATHATGLLRPVGAVPGPVTSMASSGCHRLLRDGAAVCVTDAAEVAELAGAVGSDAAEPPSAPERDRDALDAVGRRLYDALPVRREASADDIAREAGLALDETLGGLGLLELSGFARRVGAGWRRCG
jgi:DNA processing protein